MDEPLLTVDEALAFSQHVSGRVHPDVRFGETNQEALGRALAKVAAEDPAWESRKAPEVMRRYVGPWVKQQYPEALEPLGMAFGVLITYLGRMLHGGIVVNDKGQVEWGVHLAGRWWRLPPEREWSRDVPLASGRYLMRQGETCEVRLVRLLGGSVTYVDGKPPGNQARVPVSTLRGLLWAPAVSVARPLHEPALPAVRPRT